MTELSWYALRCTPQREDMTAKILRHWGFVAERKTEKRLRRLTKWDRERKLIEFCAAPGYVFAAYPESLDDPFPWYTVMSTHLVKSVVSLNGTPAKLNSLAVRRFLNFDDANWPHYYKHFKTGAEFAIGDRVIITKGPMAEFELRVDDVRAGEAIFRVLMFNRETEIAIPVDQCVRAA